MKDVEVQACGTPTLRNSHVSLSLSLCLYLIFFYVNYFLIYNSVCLIINVNYIYNHQIFFLPDRNNYHKADVAVDFYHRYKVLMMLFIHGLYVLPWLF